MSFYKNINIKNSFRKFGIYPLNTEPPDYCKPLKKVEHSSEVFLLEGERWKGETKHQVDPIQKVNARTQTLSDKYCTNLIESLGAGTTLKLCSFGCDDLVIECSRLESLRFITREK
nr:uncharacterized protein LOC105846490 [Hydra vulgaris]